MPSYKKIDKPVVSQSTPTPSPVQVREQEYRHPIVKSEELANSAIISHVEGSSLFVDYYSQRLADGNEPMAYDIHQSKVNQQYHLIKGLELKLQNQDTSTDDKTNIINVSGTAVVYAGIIPTIHDIIVSDIGSGIAGRFDITRVEKRNYTKDTVYEIDFELIEYVNTLERANVLNSYVVATSVFSKDMLIYGANPVLLEEEYYNKTRAEDVAAELIDDFLKEFFSNELSTLEVPGYGSNKTYDPYVVEAFKSVVGVSDHHLMYKLKSLNVNEIKEAYSFSIWPVLIDPSINKIHNIWKKAGPVKYNEFNINPVMNSFRYSGFNQCMSPVEDLQNVDYYHGWAQLSKRGSLMSLSRMTGMIGNSYGSAIGEQLLKMVDDSDKACCHHLVYYHEANPKALPLNTSSWLDTVNLWVRATGHFTCCSVCGGCGECCKCTDDNKNADGCVKESPYDYVLPARYWNDKSLDDEFSATVRAYLRGDKITYGSLFKMIESRQTLTPKLRYYRMMVLLIILIATMRSN